MDRDWTDRIPAAAAVVPISRMEDTVRGQFITNCWHAIMDSSRNPLRHLDLASQHYFMQVLG